MKKLLTIFLAIKLNQENARASSADRPQKKLTKEELEQLELASQKLAKKRSGLVLTEDRAMAAKAAGGGASTAPSGDT